MVQHYQIQKRTELRYVFKRIRTGFFICLYSASGIAALLAAEALIAAATAVNRLAMHDGRGLLVSLNHNLLSMLLYTSLIFVPLIYFYIKGTPRHSGGVREQLIKAGLVNHAREPPVLILSYIDPANPRITVSEYDACGIALEDWEDKQPQIETALNISVVDMYYRDEKNVIAVRSVPARGDLPDLMKWDDSLLSQKSFELVLGEGLAGPVKVNISGIPHILLGSSTGSGKSVLLKLLIMQSVKKGDLVYIADFKGGVDFPGVWHEACRMCFDKDELTAILDSLVTELEKRKQILRSSGLANIDEYNKTYNAGLKRIIFACDELAEVLDKTGLSKDDKEKIQQIESRLSVIARQDRAFGIHLMLATQRPDANILSGQIRNNIDCRICGRADNVLSQIILDSTDAADKIPKNRAGRFLLYDGTIFQSYYFDDKNVKFLN